MKESECRCGERESTKEGNQWNMVGFFFMREKKEKRQKIDAGECWKCWRET